jgi:hypothetical protein
MPAASKFIDRSVVGWGSGEDASRSDLELWNLICFEYRPALFTRLVRQTPAADFPGRAAMYTPVEGHVKASTEL